MKKLLILTILLFSQFSGSLCAEDCFGSQESHWTNCVGTSIDSYGNQYIGEWKDGRKDGQGTLTWSDGKIQKGIWENGKYLGQ